MHIMSTTAAKSVLYECIRTVVVGLTNQPPLVQLCVEKLRVRWGWGAERGRKHASLLISYVVATPSVLCPEPLSPAPLCIAPLRICAPRRNALVDNTSVFSKPAVSFSHALFFICPPVSLSVSVQDFVGETDPNLKFLGLQALQARAGRYLPRLPAPPLPPHKAVGFITSRCSRVLCVVARCPWERPALSPPFTGPRTSAVHKATPDAYPRLPA